MISLNQSNLWGIPIQLFFFHFSYEFQSTHSIFLFSLTFWWELITLISHFTALYTSSCPPSSRDYILSNFSLFCIAYHGQLSFKRTLIVSTSLVPSHSSAKPTVAHWPWRESLIVSISLSMISLSASYHRRSLAFRKLDFSGQNH